MLTPQASRFSPLVILAVILVFALLAGIWMLFSQQGFSLSSCLDVLGIVAICCIPITLLLVDHKRAQSIELTEEGVCSLVWIRPSKTKLLPALKKAFLKWSDVQRIGVKANLIYIKGPEYQVVVNTFLFRDADEVINFINRATKKS